MNANFAKTGKNKVIAVVGPTASGKTAFAIELAKKNDGEIVSADSRLVYKGLDIGTAKPSIEEREGIPHYMIDIVEPEIEYSAGLYVDAARKCIYDILSRGKTPIIAGGTGLYFRILLEAYSLPQAAPDYELRSELRELDCDTLHSMLYELDREACEKIYANDKKKLIRYIEIIKTTGKKISEACGVSEPEFDVEWLGCNFPRDILYDRINNRVDMMIENGLIEETKLLLQKHGRINNLLYTIGYQEIISYLDGGSTLDDAVTLLKQNTRRYAKRQLTWFRKNENIKWNHYPERLS